MTHVVKADLLFPDNGLHSDWQFTSVPDGPTNIQRIANSMTRSNADDPSGRATFIDFAGERVTLPVDAAGKPNVDEGLCEAVWEFLNGRIVIDRKGEKDLSGETLFRRDIDERHGGEGPDTWHPISSICAEYHVSKKSANPVWDRQFKVEAEKLYPQKHMIRGVKFTDRAYRRKGKKLICTTDPNELKMPYMVTVQQDWDPALADMARQFIDTLTADPHSADNLTRMYATPVLELYHHLGYVLRGEGGNGKSLLTDVLTRSFPRLADGINAGAIAGRRNDFSQENATLKLAGLLWAIDDDAEKITPDMMGMYKKILTGGVVTGRSIGINQIDFRAKATLIIDTNNPFIIGSNPALKRRFTFIRMKDHRPSQDVFDRLVAFINEYGVAPFIMASCEFWLAHDYEPWKDVSIGDVSDLSEAAQWVVDQICAQGYAINRENPYRPSRAETREFMAQLGLKSTVKTIGGKNTRVLVVEDHSVFDAYKPTTVEETDDTPEHPDESDSGNPDAPVPDPPTPFEDLPVNPGFGHDVIELTDFQCDYTPAGPDKVAVNWKKQATDPNVDTSRIPTDASAYTVVPKQGFIIIDMDVPKDGKSGWEVLNRQVGEYGSSAFPETWLVQTAHGGYHAYYKIPPELWDLIKDSVHNNGIPIDVRANQKGYVIGAGSVLKDGGRYKLCDIPPTTTDDGKLEIPELSEQIIRWLKRNSYMKTDTPTPPASARHALPSHYGTGRPDMSPIPEGQRNDTLHSWGYGRLIHYPDQLQVIHDDLFARGRMSGLADGEIESIWKSLMNNPDIRAVVGAA